MDNRMQKLESSRQYSTILYDKWEPGKEVWCAIVIAAADDNGSTAVIRYWASLSYPETQREWWCSPIKESGEQ
jgi:hypothetical protein